MKNRKKIKFEKTLIKSSISEEELKYLLHLLDRCIEKQGFMCSDFYSNSHNPMLSPMHFTSYYEEDAKTIYNRHIKKAIEAIRGKIDLDNQTKENPQGEPIHVWDITINPSQP